MARVAVAVMLTSSCCGCATPADKDGLPKFSLHTLDGFVLAVLPVYHTLTTLLAPAEGPFLF